MGAAISEADKIAITDTVYVTETKDKAAGERLISSLYQDTIAQSRGVCNKPGGEVRLTLMEDDKEIGGVLCGASHFSLEVQALWIHEGYRGCGFGKELLAQAETAGRAKGCLFAYASVFSYQAPEFFQACGYEVFGQLTDYPDGLARYFVKKTF